MSLNNVSRSPKTVNKQWFVHYDKWTGAIKSIGRSKNKNSTYPFIIDESDNSDMILKGLLNEKEFSVTFDDNDNLRMMKKNEIIRITRNSDELIQIPRSDMKDWDIRLKLYTKNHKLVIEINPSSISRLTRFTHRKKVMVDENATMDFYVIKHNNPDYLVESFSIDPHDLISNGSVSLDLLPVFKYVGFDEIGFLTCRIFKQYSFFVTNDTLLHVSRGMQKKKTGRIVAADNNKKSSHVQIIQTPNGLAATTNTSSDELIELGLTEDTSLIHIIGSTPDHYMGSVILDNNELRTTGYSLLHGDSSILSGTLIHSKPRLIVSDERHKSEKK